MYHYPAPLLTKQAHDGNLFALHLVSERVVLHDTLGYFASIKHAFRFKDSYKEEIIDGSLIIRFIISRGTLVNRKAARKRLVWAIRTLLIAHSAEEKKARFSSASLSTFSRISGFKEAIDDRNSGDPRDLARVAAKVLQRFGADVPGWSNDRAAQRGLLRNRGGIVASTVNLVLPKAMEKILHNWQEDQESEDNLFNYTD